MSFDHTEKSPELKCPHCGAVLRVGMLRCRDCGKLIGASTTADDVNHVTVESGDAELVPTENVASSTVRSEDTNLLSGQTVSDVVASNVTHAPKRSEPASTSAANIPARIAPPPTKTMSPVTQPRGVHPTGKVSVSGTRRPWTIWAVLVVVLAGAGSVVAMMVVWRSSADERVARWTVQQGGVVRIEMIPQPAAKGSGSTPPIQVIEEDDGSAAKPDKPVAEVRTVSQESRLPDAPFRVLEVNLADQSFDKSGLRLLTKLSGLRVLDLSRTSVTDDSLAVIGRLTTLKTLRLRGTKITSVGLQSLSELKELVDLTVSGCPRVDDAAIEVLATLPNLQILLMNGTGVSNAGLDKLAKGASKLQRLGIERTKVTPEGIARFQKAQPGCRVEEGNTKFIAKKKK